MVPIVLALAIVGPAVYSVTEYVAFRRAPPYGRRKQRAAKVRMLAGVGMSLVAVVGACILMWVEGRPLRA